jgi:serine/threonine protein phosphatase PrpC
MPDAPRAAWGVATSPGLVRMKNEDSIFAEYPVFVVADGVGGQAAGDVASLLVVDEFRALAAQEAITRDDVSRTIERANRSVVEAAYEAGFGGMGSTLVGIVLVDDERGSRWLAFNVGDSRLYRLFGGVLHQVTRDHSEVQFLVDEGAISPEAARSHPHRNVITRAIGAAPGVEPDYWLLVPAPGERFLVCSDGLTNELSDDAIAELLRAEADVSLAANLLVEGAVASGGHDNVSVVVVDVLEPDVLEPGVLEPGEDVAPD